jgi:MFS family permease
MSLTSTEYGLLYTVYAAPNTILPLFGGILVDKIGTRNALIIFYTFLVLGQGIFMIGGYRKNFHLMLVGRTIYGLGCESIYVG